MIENLITERDKTKEECHEVNLRTSRMSQTRSTENYKGSIKGSKTGRDEVRYIEKYRTSPPPNRIKTKT